MTRPIICVTPVRNEAWVLELFLKAVSRWADHIVITDQRSTDTSRDICSRFPKVELLANSSTDYDEENYRRLALDRARQIHRQALIVAMDADELLSGPAVRWLRSERLRTALPGTTWSLPWVNLQRGLERAWSPLRYPVVFVDDGVPFSGQLIHCPRIPCPERARPVEEEGACLLHLQYLCEDRLRCKQRWYQALEHVRFPRKSAIKIYRTYHQLAQLTSGELFPVSAEWFTDSGSSLSEVRRLEHATETFYWWDAEVLAWFSRFGLRHFRKFDLWDVNWNRKVADGCPGWSGGEICDPRTKSDRWVLGYLERTQQRYGSAAQRRIDRLLRILW